VLALIHCSSLTTHSLRTKPHVSLYIHSHPPQQIIYTKPEKKKRKAASDEITKALQDKYNPAQVLIRLETNQKVFEPMVGGWWGLTDHGRKLMSQPVSFKKKDRTVCSPFPPSLPPSLLQVPRAMASLLL